MNLHLVTYDLRKPGRDYATLFAAIKTLGKAIKPLQSTWIVATNYTDAQIRDHLVKFMDPNDGLLVMGLKAEAAWQKLSLTDYEAKQFIESA